MKEETETEWRRTSKPDILSSAWRPVVNGNQTWLVKALFTSHSYQLMISDRKCVWSEHLDGEDVQLRVKELNPTLEVSVVKVMDHLRDSVCDGATMSHSVLLSGNEVILTISTRLAGLPFVWKFIAAGVSTEVASQHLTASVFTMASELQRRQMELYRLLRNKDKEIQDLKSQGARVSRKHLETTPFDEVVFQSDMLTSKAFEDTVRQGGGDLFDNDGQELYKHIAMKRAWLSHVPTVSHPPTDPTFELDTLGTVGPGTDSSDTWPARLPDSLVNTTTTQSTSSPTKSPVAKDIELQRRQELEKRLAEEERKEQNRKKKKIKF